MPSKKTSSREGTQEEDPRLWTSLCTPLSSWMLDAVSNMGFSKMTPVQASTIPLFLGNKDVVVEAVTGSGKTLSFLIPIVERLSANKDGFKKGHIGGIVISPTRELAMQIFNVCENLLKFYKTEGAVLDAPCPLHPQLLIAGTTTPAQDLKAFLTRSSNLLIATPGRLNDLLASPYVLTSSFEVLVLDEADRLLDLGFKDILMKILARLPKQRRTGLFSASVTDAVEGVMGWVGVRNGVRVNVKVKGSKNEEKRTPASLDIGYILCKPSEKLFYIPQIINSTPVRPQKTIVYLATCHGVDYFSHLLPAVVPGYTIIPLHGKLTPNSRTKNFDTFSGSSGQTILLTTDLAARGLDIPEVDLVIQLDAPQDPKQFLHRCGRSGRAGRKGRAVILLTQGSEEDYVPFLKVRKTPIRYIQDTEITSPTTETIEKGNAKMRKVILSDRAIYEKGMRGFVSWVRSYKSHVAASIFRIEDVDWAELAQLWVLIKMPRMPELKHLDTAIIPTPEVDVEIIAFKDKAREKLRLAAKELAASEAVVAEASKKRLSKEEKEKKNSAWSSKLETKEEREVRRGKKRKKREQERLAGMTETERAKDDEWKSMVEEVKRMKKEEAEQNEREMDWTGLED